MMATRIKPALTAILLAAACVCATAQNGGTAFVVPVSGTGVGGSATNAQPPSTTLSNIAAVGLSTSNILWVSPAGNDSAGARARLDKPWKLPNSAMSNALPGDTVLMMPGYYDIGTNSIKIKHGAHLIGFGRNASVIQFSGNLNRSGPAVILGSTSYVAHMTIECTDRSNNFQAAIGTLSGKFFAQDFTNAFVEDIRAVSGSDAAFIDSPNPLSATFKNCQFEAFFDCFTIGASSGAGYHTIVLEDSTVFNDSTAHGAFSPALNYAVTTQYGTTTVRRCSIYNKGAIGVASNVCAAIFAAADDSLDVGRLNVESCNLSCVISNDTCGRFISCGTAGATNVFVYGTYLNRGADSGPGTMDSDGILWVSPAFQGQNYVRFFPGGGVALGQGGDPGAFNMTMRTLLSSNAWFTNKIAIIANAAVGRIWTCTNANGEGMWSNIVSVAGVYAQTNKIVGGSESIWTIAANGTVTPSGPQQMTFVNDSAAGTLSYLTLGTAQGAEFPWGLNTESNLNARTIMATNGVGIGTPAIVDVQNPTFALSGTNSSGQSVVFKIVETNQLLRFDASVNGAAYATLATLSSAGTLTIQGALSAPNNFGSFGTTVISAAVDTRGSNNSGGIIVSNNIGVVVGSVGGVGGANTNFTFQATAPGSTNATYYINAGTTNVNIVAIMGGSDSVVYRGTIVLTNRTATSRTLSLGATTNNWISLQKYDGITAPFTITNSLAGRFDYEVKGSNVFYSYKPCDLPAN